MSAILRQQMMMKKFIDERRARQAALRTKQQEEETRIAAEKFEKDKEMALIGATVERLRFEVFDITPGIFTRMPRCTDHNHERLFDACRCANITSLRDGLNNYGREFEIMMLEDDADYFTGRGVTVIQPEHINQAFKEILKARQTQRAYICLSLEDGCEQAHVSLKEAAVCAGFYDPQKGYTPCEDCTEADGVTVHTESPCYRHTSQTGVFDQEGRQLHSREVELGIRFEELAEAMTSTDEPERPASEHKYSSDVDEDEEYGDMPFDI